MKNLVFILLFVFTATVYSQTETPKDSLPSLRKGALKLDEKLENYLNIDISSNKTATNKYDMYQPLQKEEIKSVELNLAPLDIYTGPPVESNTFTKYPFANDYRYYSGMAISERAWISSSSSQATYPLVGAARTVNMQFNYQPADWLIISGGPYASKYALYGSQYNDAGVGGSAKFILNDRVRINAYGQYSPHSKHRDIGPYMSGMYPQTYYGGTLELKITEKFGIEGGIIREINPLNGKWENRPYFAPVFYSK